MRMNVRNTLNVKKVLLATNHDNSVLLYKGRFYHLQGVRQGAFLELAWGIWGNKIWHCHSFSMSFMMII